MKTSEKIDHDVKVAIDWLLEHDVDITARSVAARMDGWASSITRNEDRMNAVLDAAVEQVRLRAIIGSNKSSREALVAKVDRRDKMIAELERKIMILTASHRAMLIAVGEIGGVAAWLKFFAKHEEIRQELIALHAIPNSLEINVS